MTDPHQAIEELRPIVEAAAITPGSWEWWDADPEDALAAWRRATERGEGDGLESTT